MLRAGLILMAGLGLTAAALGQGQRPIQWISNVQQGVTQARRLGLPIMFYVAGSSRGDGGDLDDAQQRTFRDPLVGSLAQQRFVAIRLARSTETTELLAQIGVGSIAEAGSPSGRRVSGGRAAASRLGRYVVCTTPGLELIGVIPPGQITDARAFARQMTGMFRTYRVGVFERELKPTLEDEGAKPGAVTKALRTIKRLLILEADQSVARLLESDGLSKTVQKEVYDTLAILSTSPSVKALLEAAVYDKLAAKALERCTPGAAQELLPALDPEKPEQFLVAYQAVAKICKIKGTKPRGFWSGGNQAAMDQELERVKNEASRIAKRWRETYEAYR